MSEIWDFVSSQEYSHVDIGENNGRKGWQNREYLSFSPWGNCVPEKHQIWKPVATKVKELQVELNFLGILKQTTLLLAICGSDPPRSFEYPKVFRNIQKYSKNNQNDKNLIQNT